MTRNEKVQVVENLTSEFKAAETVIVADYKGLKVSELEGLRKLARENEASVQVVKNTLASIALENAEKSGLELKNTNVLIWGVDPINTSKAVSKFAESNKAFTIKSAFIEGEVAGVEKVEAFAKLPNREELLGMLASVWMAPVRNFTIGLDQLRIQKEEAGE